MPSPARTLRCRCCVDKPRQVMLRPPEVSTWTLSPFSASKTSPEFSFSLSLSLSADLRCRLFVMVSPSTGVVPPVAFAATPLQPGAIPFASRCWELHSYCSPASSGPLPWRAAARSTAPAPSPSRFPLASPWWTALPGAWPRLMAWSIEPPSGAATRGTLPVGRQQPRVFRRSRYAT